MSSDNKLLNLDGTPVIPKQTQPKPLENPEAARRLVKFDPKQMVDHVLERKHNQTYQIVSCQPETFSPLMGLFLINVAGVYYRTETKKRKDALGREFMKTEVVAIVHVDDKPL